ncbi:hypothetical protein FHS43_005101 [Streptosporangium becharense]|uniref:Uncharacterized protein n=1 Tax=Streptosporangium becharense TaxID=1816182 RepID=A0A7W9MF28_9ACTN|nr:hypothetical protein [Streptosporangium becharense]MBB2913792.1 hypothetical protein [Streptosporangium becharense]MBB5817873.1 hypothetical protein [Streptosporangium becharense]
MRTAMSAGVLALTLGGGVSAFAVVPALAAPRAIATPWGVAVTRAGVTHEVTHEVTHTGTATDPGPGSGSGPGKGTGALPGAGPASPVGDERSPGAATTRGRPGTAHDDCRSAGPLAAVTGVLCAAADDAGNALGTANAPDTANAHRAVETHTAASTRSTADTHAATDTHRTADTHSTVSGSADPDDVEGTDDPGRADDPADAGGLGDVGGTLGDILDGVVDGLTTRGADGARPAGTGAPGTTGPGGAEAAEAAEATGGADADDAGDRTTAEPSPELGAPFGAGEASDGGSPPETANTLCAPPAATAGCTGRPETHAPRRGTGPDGPPIPDPSRTRRPGLPRKDAVAPPSGPPTFTGPFQPSGGTGAARNRTATGDEDDPAASGPSTRVDAEAPRVELLWPGPLMEKLHRQMPQRRQVTPSRPSDWPGTVLTAALLVVAIFAVRLLYGREKGSIPFEPVSPNRHRVA